MAYRTDWPVLELLLCLHKLAGFDALRSCVAASISKLVPDIPRDTRRITLLETARGVATLKTNSQPSVQVTQASKFSSVSAGWIQLTPLITCLIKALRLSHKPYIC
jgi:hypothetical protein